MANRRMLSKSISYSKQVNNLSNYFRKLLFSWTIPHLDDFGRIDGDPEVLKAMVMPMCELSIKEFEDAIKEFVGKGLAIRYEVGDKRVIVFPTFDKYQVGLNKRTKSKYPDKPGSPRNSENLQEIPRNSNTTEAKRREQNRKEANTNNDKSIADKDTDKKGFELMNPKDFKPANEGETAAYNAWKKLEPHNPIALQSTYLSAHKKGISAQTIYEFVSEIKQDKNVKNNGAVFNKKIQDYLS